MNFPTHISGILEYIIYSTLELIITPILNNVILSTSLYSLITDHYTIKLSLIATSSNISISKIHYRKLSNINYCNVLSNVSIFSPFPTLH